VRIIVILPCMVNLEIFYLEQLAAIVAHRMTPTFQAVDRSISQLDKLPGAFISLALNHACLAGNRGLDSTWQGESELRVNCSDLSAGKSTGVEALVQFLAYMPRCHSLPYHTGAIS